MPKQKVRYFDREGVPYVQINAPNSSLLFRMDGNKRVSVKPWNAVIIVSTSNLCSKQRAEELAAKR